MCTVHTTLHWNKIFQKHARDILYDITVHAINSRVGSSISRWLIVLLQWVLLIFHFHINLTQSPIQARKISCFVCTLSSCIFPYKWTKVITLLDMGLGSYNYYSNVISTRIAAILIMLDKALHEIVWKEQFKKYYLIKFGKKNSSTCLVNFLLTFFIYLPKV